MCLQMSDWINTACRKKQELTIPQPCLLQALIGSNQIGSKHIIRRAILASQNRWLGRTFDNEIKGAYRESIGISHITTVELHTSFLQSRNIQFRAAPVQIVHTNDCCVRTSSPKMQRKIRTNKACATSN